MNFRCIYSAIVLLILGSYLSTQRAQAQKELTGKAISPPLKETSITLAQIVARQRATLSQIQTARGVAVWRELLYTTTSQSAPPLRLVHFAYCSTASVNLIFSWDGRSPVAQVREKPDWTKVLAAFLVADDKVYSIKPSGSRKQGWISVAPYNPAVHERNPLVSFRIELLADEPVTLADLFGTQNSMAAPPKVYLETTTGGEKLWVIFSNPNLPGEELRYLINPAKGYLAEYIGRFSQKRKIHESFLTIGKTKQGHWIPARRKSYDYTRDGTVTYFSDWYFHSVEVNTTLAPYELSFAYFHLPPEAWPQTIQTNEPAKQ
ncbi:MAG: hypothetical protein N2Z21_03855 [Candidatus Sumerlaeaceae bacterium]|nr:hypothetical protein [Candidatus Sumerlaeaceae bacterium]